MKIGIDVDGVLTDLYSYQLENGKKYFKTANYDETKNNVKEIFNCTKEEMDKFWIKYIWKYCLSTPPRPGVSSIINKLKKDGHEIYIITSRAHSTKDNIVGSIFRKMLILWLDKNAIPYDHIIFCDDKKSDLDKYIACRDNNIDIMIDDEKENLVAVKTVCNAICYTQKYNMDINNVDRINDFGELNEKIKKYKK